MTDERIADGLSSVLEHWTAIDLYECNTVLDALDRAEANAAKRNAG